MAGSQATEAYKQPKDAGSQLVLVLLFIHTRAVYSLMIVFAVSAVIPLVISDSEFAGTLEMFVQCTT